MTNSLKQFAALISNFIDQSLMPIIQSKMSENCRIVEQWIELRTLINDADTI